MTITGYRNLDQDSVDLINKIKLHGQILNELTQEVKLHILAQRAHLESLNDNEKSVERRRLNDAEPERWTTTGKVSLQTGVMDLVRAIAQPSGF